MPSRQPLAVWECRVLIGTSEGERALSALDKFAAVVKSIRHEYDFPIFLIGDHTHSLAKAEEAARAGGRYERLQRTQARL
jgi:fructose/tagatose bisphosphate aldolase